MQQKGPFRRALFASCGEAAAAVTASICAAAALGATAVKIVPGTAAAALPGISRCCGQKRARGSLNRLLGFPGRAFVAFIRLSKRSKNALLRLQEGVCGLICGLLGPLQALAWSYKPSAWKRRRRAS